MTTRKLRQLLDAARKEKSPAPSEGLSQRVMQTICREAAKGERAAISLFDQLTLLFPRLALAAALIIVLCIAGDLLSSAMNLPDLNDGLAQLSEEGVLMDNVF